MSGAERIAAERRRQVDEKGYTSEHDAEHDGDLVRAALSYSYTALYGNRFTRPDPLWPWEPEAWKPSDDPVRNLEKAGALIAAEIDRLLNTRTLCGGIDPAYPGRTCTFHEGHDGPCIDPNATEG